MSGTSLDGLDLAYCTFEHTPKGWRYFIDEAETISYDDSMTNFLVTAFNSSANELVEKDHIFGRYIGERVRHFLDKHQIETDIIASHGHTIFHQPENGFTFQLGNGADIASVSEITTICDFRSMDVANGGQGAPLVPVGDDLLFGKYEFCLNLGGFSNISFRENKKRVAFDISPVNIFLNKFANSAGKPFDRDGIIASEGEVHIKLLEDLNHLEYYSQPFPKSLGREWFESEFLPIVEKHNILPQNVLRTGCEHIAVKIAEVLNKKLVGKVLITGGGALNLFLMKLISDKTKIKIVIPDLKLVHYKEAMVFAFLGVLRYRNEINCYSSVTGAGKNSSCGAIYAVGGDKE